MKRALKVLVNLFVLATLVLTPVQPSDVYAEPYSQTTSASISGRVTDLSGNGVSGATILAVLDPLYVYLPNIVRSGPSGGTKVSNLPESGQNYYTVETDIYGFYNLDTLPPGRYVISTRKMGQDFSPLSYSINTTNGGSEYDFQEKVIPTVYTLGTITLSDATLAELLSVSADGTTYTFANETSDLAQADPGDVLIGGISTLTPEGFLRKVVSVFANGTERTIVTEQATLEDAFESLSVQMTQRLTIDQVKNPTYVPGVILSTNPSLMGLGDLQFGLVEAVLYDSDGDIYYTRGDQIVANGILSVSPNIDFRIRIEDGALEEFYYTTSMNVEADITFSSDVSMNISIPEINLAPTIYLSAIQVGPLVLVPTIDIIAGIAGSVFTGVSASITNSTIFTAGLWHVDHQARNLNNFSSIFSFTPLTFQNSLSFKAFLGPKVSMMIYGVVGGYVKPDVALTLNIAPVSDTWLMLRGGFEVLVGLGPSISIVGPNMPNIQLGAINHWSYLYSLSTSSTAPPNPPSNPTPPHGSMNQSLTALMNWIGGNSLVYDVYFNMGNVIPLTKVSDHQSSTTFNPGTLSMNTTYSWRIRVFDEHGVSSDGPVWRFTTGDGTVIPGEMILVPAGEFEMGCDYEHNGDHNSCADGELPLHTVYLDAYRIDKYEVTNAQYAQCVAAGNCAAPAKNYSHTHASYYDNPVFVNHPVMYLSWYDSVNYCTWAGKRLPTEAEWEKAARGPTIRGFPWGDQYTSCSLVNYLHTFGGVEIFCVGDTSAVGSFPSGASPYGAMDMAGNVWEWVSDWYDSNYYQSQSTWINPTGPVSGTNKVRRGGSWGLPEYYVRGAHRADTWPLFRFENLGFRCAASP